MMLRLFGVLALHAVLTASSADAQPPHRAALEKRLAGLLRERVEELRKEVTARENEYKAGRGLLDFLLQALQDLGQDELELSNSPKQQVAAYTPLIQRMRAIEMIVKKRFDDHRLPIQDYMQVRASRALAEYALVQAQMQIAGADKAKLMHQLDELRRECLDAHQAVLAAGRGFTLMVLDAQRDLGRAELALATSPQERRQAQERLLKAAQDRERVDQAKFAAGRISMPELLYTRAERIEAEIALGGDRVTQLRKELVTTWQPIVAARENEVRSGRGTSDVLAEAQAGLARAEMALTTDLRRRVTYQETIVKAKRTIEDFIHGYYKTGRMPVQEFLHAKGARMTAEIELVRLQLQAQGR